MDSWLGNRLFSSVLALSVGVGGVATACWLALDGNDGLEGLDVTEREVFWVPLVTISRLAEL